MRGKAVAMGGLLKALCVLAVSALQACASDQPLTLDMSGREMTFSKSGRYDLVVLEGAAMTTQVGAPSLPTIAVNVVVPQDMRVTGVTCLPTTTDEVEGSCFIVPVQRPRPISDTGRPSFVPPDPIIYNSDGPYPRALGMLAGQNSMRGYNVASLIVYPLQYSPKSRMLRFHRKLTLSLAMEPADLGYLPVGHRSREARDSVEEEIRSVVVNPADVSRFAPNERQRRSLGPNLIGPERNASLFYLDVVLPCKVG
jgi:hypothetical protein